MILSIIYHYFFENDYFNNVLNKNYYITADNDNNDINTLNSTLSNNTLNVIKEKVYLILCLDLKK